MRALETRRREGVAGVRVAAVEAGPEPVRALLGRPVRPRLRIDACTGGLLDSVVAHRGGGGQRLLEVAALEHPPLLDRVAPYAREAVGLQLHPHGQLVLLARV